MRDATTADDRPPTTPASPIKLRATARTFLSLTLGIALLALLHLTSMHDYLVFHAIVEMFSVVVAFSAFALAWYSREFLRHNYLLLLGTSYLFIGGIDLLHTLSYKGMGIFPDDDANLPTQLWIVARYLEGAAFLVAMASPTRRFNAAAVFTAFLVPTAAALGAIFVGSLFPDCFVEGQGLTPFKKNSEYVIVGFFLIALALLHRNRRLFDERIYRFLVLATVSRIAAELFFTFYIDVYGLSNFFGHIFKVIAFYGIFKGIIETGVVRPQALIAHSLERERRLAAEIERQARLLETVLSASPDPMFLIDRDRRFSYVNPTAARLHARPQAEWVGRSWRDPDQPMPMFSSLEAQLCRTFDTGEPNSGEIALDDRRHEYQMVPVTDGTGAVGAVLAVVRDITERARAAERLRAALQETEWARAEADRANDAKTRFLAAASHDLRQPLQAARLFLEVLDQKLRNAEDRPILKKAMEALDGCEDLLRALLDLSTLQAGTVKPGIVDFPIQAVFDKLVDESAPQAHAKGIDFRLVDSDATVRSDPVLLQRILRNFVTNAIRYTASGRILIGCRQRGGSHLRIDIVDTGSGIPADQQDAIFEEFFQVGNAARNRSEGLGLGLSIVQRMAALLDHPISVRSEFGRGSTFSIQVPLVANTPRTPTPTPPAPAIEPPPPSSGTPTPILVVENDPHQLTALEFLLNSWNYPVIAVSGTGPALDAVAAGIIPVLVITDFRLPGTLSGIDLVMEIRRRTGQAIPAVLITGDTDPKRLREAEQSDLVLLHKPFPSGRLRDAIAARLADA